MCFFINIYHFAFLTHPSLFDIFDMFLIQSFIENCVISLLRTLEGDTELNISKFSKSWLIKSFNALSEICKA